MKNQFYVKFTLFLAALVIVGLLAFPTAPTYADPPAAPPAAPTPISNVVSFPKKTRVRTVFPETAITADTNTTGFCFGDEYSRVDYGILIDHGTANTTSVIIEFSNDNTNWEVGPNLITDSVADVYELTPIGLTGWCARFDLDVATTNTITIGITALPRG